MKQIHLVHPFVLDCANVLSVDIPPKLGFFGITVDLISHFVKDLAVMLIKVANLKPSEIHEFHAFQLVEKKAFKASFWIFVAIWPREIVAVFHDGEI